MGKNCIIFVIWFTICFGQQGKSEIAVSLIPPHGTNGNFLLPQNSFMTWRLIFNSANNLSLSQRFYLNALITQVEGESLKPKTSCWKQVGICGLEFIGAGVVGTAISYYAAYIAEGGGDFDHPTYAILGYAVGQTLFTSSCTWITGKLLGQKGSWRKSALGAASGCLTGIPIALLLNKRYPEGFLNGVALSIFLVTPPSGAVIGFNWGSHELR